MKQKLEYIWLDGYKPEPNLRSKIKIVDLPHPFVLEDVPDWSFDGSSTQQAEGNFSDCILKPVRVYHSFDIKEWPTSYILCEVYNPDGTPHSTNVRSTITDDEDFWFGFEQEYFIRNSKTNQILGHDTNHMGQGKFYCGVGSSQVSGREFVEHHLSLCLNAGIDITGINAEVALGQWEYQVFSKGKLLAGDDLWMSRYLLMKLAEMYGYTIDFHPKPLPYGDWNGSGLHCNLSNKKMREEGGEDYFKSIFRAFDVRQQSHIEVYGSDNHLRLTGKHETQSIDKFSWGISDRGASIRVPLSTAKEWKGYIEDRRPASNADPYKIVKVIETTMMFVEELMKTNHNIFTDKQADFEKFGGLSNDEIMKEYMDDENYSLTKEMMESKLNIEPQNTKDFQSIISELKGNVENKTTDKRFGRDTSSIYND